MDEINLDASREELLRRWSMAQEKMKAQESELARKREIERDASELQAENAILKSQLEKLSGEVKLKNEQISELFRKWQNSNMTFLLKENGELSKKWRQAEDLADEVRQKLQSAQTALTEKEHQLSAINHHTAEKDSQIAILVRKFEELKAENSRLQSELQKLHSEDIGQLEEKVREISLMREEQEQMEQKMKQKAHEMEMGYQEKDIEMQKLLLQFGQFKMQFQQECARLQDENQALKSAIQEKDLQIESLQETARTGEISNPLGANPSIPRNLSASAESDFPSGPPIAEQNAGAPPAAAKVLLVESNPESAAIIGSALKKGGYDVVSSHSADEILSACRSGAVQALLMNIVMADLDVYALSRQLAQDSAAKKVPCVLMASNPATTEIFKQDGECSVKSFLYKPFSIEELLATIDYVLAPGIIKQ